MSKREIRPAVARAAADATLVDRVVGYFSPVQALQRQRARISMALAGSYTGASKSRRATSEWKTTSGSADAAKHAGATAKDGGGGGGAQPKRCRRRPRVADGLRQAAAADCADTAATRLKGQ